MHRQRSARAAHRSVASLLVLASLAPTACDDDDESRSPAGGGGGGSPPGPTFVVDLVVDASRDGVVDASDPADREGEDDALRGAMFLPNLDDDDGDGVRDCDETFANGAGDELDRTPIVLAACPSCPGDAKAVLSIDPGSAAFVRIFRVDEAGVSTLVLGQTGSCSDADPTCATSTRLELGGDVVQTGASFAIEARDVMRGKDDSWNGVATLTLSLTDAEGAPLATDDNPDAIDRVTMRVAPWQLFGNLSPFDRVWFSDDSPTFAVGVRKGALQAGAEDASYSNYGDQWTQDFMQTGFFQVVRPGANGPEVHGMRVANARPWGRSNSPNSLPIRWLERNYLAADQGVFYVYDVPNSGDSYDSHGNHDLIPPYENGDDRFPLGRIIIGSGVLPETKAFYAAQELQAPIYVGDTSWLWVGHIDEYVSYVPAATPRGWKLLVASPRRAREMLLELQQNGLGATELHVGKEWYDWNSGQYVSADISVDDLLADADILEASQNAQAFIDQELTRLSGALGLGDDEIVEMPFLFEAIQEGGTAYHLAYQPGTVNALVLGDVFVSPKPFGPKVDGVDVFEADLEERLGTSSNAIGSDGQGMSLVFVDNWDYYHALNGEVHCGTNPDAPAPYSSVAWWEVSQ